MIVGLTYDLKQVYRKAGYREEEIAELDSEVTVDALSSALASLGHLPVRIGHARQLMARLLEGERWDLVFNIAEGLFGTGRESLVPALLDQHRIPYTFSDPLVTAVTLHKGIAKRLVQQAGLPTAPFAIVERRADAESVDLPTPLFVKPVAEGTSKGITGRSIVYHRSELWPRCEALLEQYGQPVLVECYLPGREVTVGILGTGEAARAIGVLEVELLEGAEQGVYSYFNKQSENWRRFLRYRGTRPEESALAREAADLALACWRTLGCRDAGRVDLRWDADGQCNFLEVNPLAGIHPEDSDLTILCGQLGISYVELVEGIVRSASQRVGLPAAAEPRALSSAPESSVVVSMKARRSRRRP